MPADSLLLVAGLVLLVAGGDGLVRGASALAYRFGVSPLLVGLTVVAFGTSAPELSVNVAAALTDRGEITLANVMGSIIANVGLAIGLVAALRGLAIERALIVREIPMLTLGTVAALVLGADALLTHASGPVGYSRADGLTLLLFFAIFLYYTIGEALRQRGAAAGGRPAQADLPTVPRALAYFALGLGGLVLGGDLTVAAASRLALQLGLSPAFVGLTVVALGTSLPEIVTSLMGALRGSDAIAVGNVIGSNIFNVLFVLGSSAALRDVPVPPGGVWDLLAALAFSVALLPISFNPARRIGRRGGILLVAGYVAFIAWRAAAA